MAATAMATRRHREEIGAILPLGLRSRPQQSRCHAARRVLGSTSWPDHMLGDGWTHRPMVEAVRAETIIGLHLRELHVRMCNRCIPAAAHAAPGGHQDLGGRLAVGRQYRSDLSTDLHLVPSVIV